MGAFALTLAWNDREIVDGALLRAETSLRGMSHWGWQRWETPGIGILQARSSVAEPSFVSTAARWRLVLDGSLCTADRQVLRAHCDDETTRALFDVSDDVARLETLLDQRGGAALQSLHGDIALAAFDTLQQTLWLFRGDAGGRGLYVCRSDNHWHIASRASAAAAMANRTLIQNDAAIAAYFALRAPAPGQTFFRGVEAVQPGALWSVRAQELLVMPAAARARVEPRADDRDEVLQGRWADCLNGAMSEALSASIRPGIMLSGGIDSATLAAFGASLNPDLIACSWALPATPSSNEHDWIRSITESLKLRHETFCGDDDWPLSRLESWPVEDDGPPANPYRRLHDRLYARAAALGCDALVSGNFGDHLYADASGWLRSAAAVRGWPWALRTLAQFGRREGLAALWRESGWRAVVRRARVSKDWAAPDWIQPEFAASLALEQGAEPPRGDAFSAESIQDAELGRRFHLMHGIEMLTPYRNPQVVAFTQSLPAFHHARAGQHKFITREILRGRVPEPVRMRPKGGSLVAFFTRGVVDESVKAVAQLLDSSDARWPEFVKPQALQAARASLRSESDLLLIWLCISYELWWRAHWAQGPAVLASRAEINVVSGGSCD